MAKAKKAKPREPRPPRELSKERLAAIEAGRAAQGPLGQRLRTLRAQHKLTQAELGTRVDISQKYISELECGRKSPSWETLVAIAKLGFRISLSMMLFGIDEPIDDDVPRLQSLLAGRPRDVQANILSALQHMLRALGPP
jgi:transcriptional regulator with XRE-family HTH domain